SSLHGPTKILELGCGNGRLTSLLTHNGHSVVGLDKSCDMLQMAKPHMPPSTLMCCMDMCNFAFSTSFKAIIIPYNTLHLLGSVQKVKRCLTLCREHLTPGGILLLHLHIPIDLMEKPGKRFFQFQILSNPSGGKVIKETLRKYDPNSDTLSMEERYRVRPFNKNMANKDLHHFLTLYTPSFSTWKDLLVTSCFTIQKQYGDYQLSSYQQQKDQRLLLVARAI
ncbi:MAG: class I SAM-dependent methyltransferase, partial [Bacteroidetes bacterium]|nr:class I SAM-dependent methyltransferase [Bacteroidota bacterium]